MRKGAGQQRKAWWPAPEKWIIGSVPWSAPPTLLFTYDGKPEGPKAGDRPRVALTIQCRKATVTGIRFRRWLRIRNEDDRAAVSRRRGASRRALRIHPGRPFVQGRNATRVYHLPGRG